ncbi:calcium-dependent secretion activator 1 isoform X1, partial [Tachysurus ichikawai]
NGSGTSEDLFWKLDALQTFIRDLHWPEEEFAKHLEMRLKLMSSDMIESCVKRTRVAFEVKLQKSSRTTDFRVPQSICTMFNVMVDARAQSAKLCAMELGQERQYHSQIDNLIEETVKEMITLLVAKFVVILESVLAKLSRYDEGTLFSSFLSFTVKAASKYVDVPKPSMDVADAYVTFVRHSQDILRDKVNEEMYIERLFDSRLIFLCTSTSMTRLLGEFPSYMHSQTSSHLFHSSPPPHLTPTPTPGPPSPPLTPDGYAGHTFGSFPHLLKWLCQQRAQQTGQAI